MVPELSTYKGYSIVVRKGQKPPVAVFDPRDPGIARYTAWSLKEAKRWVDAYRDGVNWAIEARHKQETAQ